MGWLDIIDCIMQNMIFGSFDVVVCIYYFGFLEVGDEVFDVLGEVVMVVDVVVYVC